MGLLEKIDDGSAVLGVVGLGYVGLPLAVEMGKAGHRVIGLEVSSEKAESINAGQSYIPDVPSAEVKDLANLGQMISDKLEELQRPDKKVLLKADLQAAYGRVVDALSAIKDAQIEVIGLVTEQKASSME